MPRNIKDMIECQVDIGGVDSVLDILADVCAEKSERTMASYQDAGLHAKWKTLEKKVRACRESVLPWVKS